MPFASVFDRSLPSIFEKFPIMNASFQNIINIGRISMKHCLEQIISHLTRNKVEIFSRNFHDYRLTHEHCFHSKSSIPPNQNLINNKIRLLIELARLMMRDIFDKGIVY